MCWSYGVAYCMEQSPSWEANRLSASQEIRIVWNLKVHNRILKCPPPVPILSQIDSVRAPTSHCLKIHRNIKLPSTPGSFKWAVPLGFPHLNPVYTFPPPYVLHSPPTYHPNSIGWGVQIIELLVWSGARDRKRAVEKVAGGFWARCNEDDGDSDGCPAHPSENSLERL